MPNADPRPTDDNGSTREDLHRSLDRVAAALEQQNKQEAKKAGESRDQKKEDREQQKGDAKTTKSGKAKRFFKSPLGILLVLILLVAIIIGAVMLWRYESTHESTDDAYTASHVHQISPRVAGTVLEVWVDDNQQVKQGDLLVKLDPSDYEVALQRAQSNLDQAKAQVLQAQTAIAQAYADYAQAQSQVAAAQAQVVEAAARYQVAGIDYKRNAGLYTRDVRAVAEQDVDTTKSNLDAARGALDAAKANAQSSIASEASAKSMIGTREAELVVAKAAVETNQANVANAKLQLSYCWVLSPCDGRVSRKTVETGQQLTAGQALMAVTESDVWVLANFKETQLEYVRVGQPVKIPIDAFKGHPFTGRVDSIQDGSGATYSLLPPDNATGNFTKIVQRVPIKITFDRDSVKGYERLIVPGLSAVPIIDLSGPVDRRSQVSKVNTADRRIAPAITAY